jgi:16S rRNA (adenine1518-N6/adenine1519-N6)-dimethyltransferase
VLVKDWSVGREPLPPCLSEEDLTAKIPALLRAHGLYPRKGLGQNFLISQAALDDMVAAADLSAEDVVVEVGAGLGTLTRLLAREAGRVVAVELDSDLVEILRHELADLPNVEIIHGDILQISDLGFSHGGYKVVGNLPYYITSAVLRRFLEKAPRPEIMVVTVQREVAERIVAGPGEMSLLAISVQFYGQPSIVARIKAGSFYPPPQVDSAVVRIDVGQHPTVLLGEGTDDQAFFRVVRAGFGQKRKMLRNALSAGLGMTPLQVENALGKAGIDPRRRAETLSLGEWVEVTREIYLAAS